jgi:hypothetical protein
MEPESSSPYPQVPATCPYPEPTPSSPHDPFQLPEVCGHLPNNNTKFKDQLEVVSVTTNRNMCIYIFIPMG